MSLHENASLTRPLAMALTLPARSLLLVALVLMIEGTQFGIWATSRFGLNPALLTTWRYLQWGIAVVFAMLAVELLYHFGPDLKQRFRDSLPGAIVAVMTWIGLSNLLGSYFRHFDSVDSTYGPLGAAIGLYIWFYLSGLAVLLDCLVERLMSCLENYGNAAIYDRQLQGMRRSTIWMRQREGITCKAESGWTPLQIAKSALVCLRKATFCSPLLSAEDIVTILGAAAHLACHLELRQQFVGGLFAIDDTGYSPR